MIEIKNKFHIQRMFASSLQRWDFLKAVDYTCYLGDVSKAPKYYHIENGYSCKTDLGQSMDDIMASMKSNTRNEIRRAEKEGCEYVTDVSFEEFVPFYNDFCKSKGFSDLTTIGRLEKYRTTKITKVVHNGMTLSMHAHVVDEEAKLVFLLFSCSPRLDAGVDKKLIGWANRYLHYKDMELFKSMGIQIYEWAGLTLDTNDPRYSIGQYKLSFGGELYSTVALHTPLYRLLLKLRTLALKIMVRK